MKKFMSIALVLALVLLCASPAFSAVGVKQGVSHYHVGDAVDIDVGEAGYFDGDTLYLGYTSINSVSTMASGPAAIPVTCNVVHQVFSSADAPGSTLANGTVGQILLLDVTTNASSYVWTITPATKIGYSTIKLSHVGSYAVLMYINALYGWQVIDSKGATIV